MKAVPLIFIFLVYLAFTSTVQAQKLFEESTDALPKEIERMYVKGLQFLAKSQLASGGFKDNPYGTSPGAVSYTHLTLPTKA